MVQLLTTLVLNAALIAPSGDAARPHRGATPEDERAIASLHARDAEASKAKDAAALAELWTEDFVSLRPGEAPVRGRNANEASLARALEAVGSTEVLDSSIELEEVVVVGDIAYEWGAYRGRFRPAPSADTIQQQGHVMRILARQPDGGWKIARAIFTPSTAARDVRKRQGYTRADRTFVDLVSSPPRLFGAMVPCIEP